MSTYMYTCIFIHLYVYIMFVYAAVLFPSIYIYTYICMYVYLYIYVYVQIAEKTLNLIINNKVVETSVVDFNTGLCVRTFAFFFMNTYRVP